MGTNFYWSKNPQTVLDYAIESPLERSDSIKIHIGKRSAAGPYCWDCGTTLHSEGDREVHYSERSRGWLDHCPSCGKSLGQGEPGVDRSGVMPCCSFTWTLRKHRVTLERLGASSVKVACDEYGGELTASEMLAIVDACPIQFQVPCEFS